MNAPQFHCAAHLIVLLGVLASGTTARAAPGDVKTSFDAPCKYPAGLAADGQHLFLLDSRYAKVYELTPQGQTVRSWDAPTLKPHGLAWGDGKLYISDDHTGRVYAVDCATGIVENTFDAPGAQPTGLAYARGNLFLLERSSGKVYKVLPEDGTIVAQFAIPDANCTCLTFDGKHLWISNRVKDEIYLVHPDTGMVLGILATPGPYPAGLAWLDNTLWNVDFQTRKVYQLIVEDQEMYRLWDTREARVEYLWSLSNYGPGEVRNLTVHVAIPQTSPNQALLSEPEFSVAPTKLVSDRWGQPCAVFDLGVVPPGSKKEVTYSVNARISAIRYLIIPEKAGTLADIPETIRAEYTVDDSRYGVSSPYIQKTVKEIGGDERNCYWIARRIYNFIISHLEYEMAGGWDIPEVVIQRGKGSCSEYTFAFIALCRAAGLPARYQGSVVVRGDDASVDEAFHRWAEIYLPNYGWIPVDANRGDATSPVDQARGIGELANRFLITTRSGGGSEFLKWGYNSFATYQTTGYCKVEEENFGFWEPLTTTMPAPSTAGEKRAVGTCQP